MRKIITRPHTRSEQHINGMIGSWGRRNLTDLGIEQAERIGKNLREEIKNDRYLFYSSDLLRAAHTAEIVAAYLNVEPIYGSLLREFYSGIAVG